MPSAQWRRKHPEGARDLLKKYRSKLKEECFTAYGHKCLSCSETSTDKLEIDHLNGQGNKHRDSIFGYGHNSPGGWNFYRVLKQAGYPQDQGLALICKDCHDLKHGRLPSEERKGPPAYQKIDQPTYPDSVPF